VTNTQDGLLSKNSDKEQVKLRDENIPVARNVPLRDHHFQLRTRDLAYVDGGKGASH